MSYSNSSGRDYRGRGKKAAQHLKPRSDDAATAVGGEQEDGLFQPIDADAVAPAEGAAGVVDAASLEQLGADDVAAREDASGSDGGGASDSGAPDASTPEPSQGAEAASAPYARDAASYKHRRGFWRNLSGPQRALVIAVVAVVVAVAVAGGVLFAMWQNTQDNIKLQDTTIEEELQPVVAEEPYWTLILGSDARPSESKTGTRSDVIMLARVDERAKLVTLVSIPRDTKVTLEGYGTQKINAAYAFGGAKLAIKTVEAYANVSVSHYVEVYFKGFSKLVDQIGGVTVNVPEYVSYGGVTLKPGEQTLNGKQALVFARNRKTYKTGDFRRTEAQRILVTAIAKKVLSQDATKLPDTIDALSKCFSTDMPLSDIVRLATVMQGADEDSFYSAMCPSEAGMIDGVSYTFTRIYQWKLVMQKAAAGDDPKLTKKEKKICGTTPTTQSEELDMKEALPADITKQLQAYWKQQKEEAAQKETAQQQAAGSSGGAAGEAGQSSGQGS